MVISDIHLMMGFMEYQPERNWPLVQKLDRYSGERGRFLARDGASYGGRALPPGTDKLAPYHQYEVTKRITVKSGPTTPWFDEVGKGAQYETEKSAEQLIALGCLRRIS